MNKVIKVLVILTIFTITVLYFFENNSIQKQKISKETDQINYLTQTNSYRLYKFNNDDEARCLDGSAAAFYFVKGKSNKFLINFQGGGTCIGKSIGSTFIKCYERSKTNLGSSQNYQQELHFESGIMSRDPLKNPNFFNYSSLYIPYCDGMLHSAYRKDMLEQDGVQLYLKGKINTMKIIQYALDNLDLKLASEIIVSGQSAGGVSVYNWVDYIAETVRNVSFMNPKIFGIADSGIFLEVKNIQNGIDVIDLAGKALESYLDHDYEFPNRACALKFHSSPFECFKTRNLIPLINSPLFIIQSQYDSYAIQYVLGVNCLKGVSLNQCNYEQRLQIENYRQINLEFIKELSRQNNNWGIWSPACVSHVFSSKDNFINTQNRIPSNSSFSVSESIREWLNTFKSIHIDKEPWPTNKQCSGL